MTWVHAHVVVHAHARGAIRVCRVSTLQPAARDARIAACARESRRTCEPARPCASSLAMTAIGWMVLPWAVVALVLVLRLPPDPSPATTRRLLATNEPASQPAHCADDDVTRQVLEALPYTAPLLRALASFHAVSAEYFPDLCPEER